MPEQHTDPWDTAVPRDAVAANLGGAYWSVHECRWENVGAALPDDLVDLLAPPIVVGAAPCAVDVAPGPDDEATALDHLEMLIFDPQHPMIAPALPRRSGRHRRTVRVG
jgi:hypothetical protein